jgi:hypothetical protein
MLFYLAPRSILSLSALLPSPNHQAFFRSIGLGKADARNLANRKSAELSLSTFAMQW